MQVWLFGARIFVVRNVKMRYIFAEEFVILETIGLGIQSDLGCVDVVNGLPCGVFVTDPGNFEFTLAVQHLVTKDRLQFVHIESS